MRRQIIAGALACLGSSVFGQTAINPTNQLQGVSNQIQGTVKSNVPNAQGKVDAGVQQNAGANTLGNVQNRSTLNAQGQANGAAGLNGNLGVQSDTRLQNNSIQQPGQLNANLSTQVQGQSALGAQGQANIGQQPRNMQWNGNNTTQPLQQQGQPSQFGQSQPQGWNGQTNQNTAGSLNRVGMDSGNIMQGGSMQQPGQSQAAGPVYMLRIDASGREFICVNGSAVYFDNANSLAGQGNAGNSYRAGYGSYDANRGDNSTGRSSNNAPPVPSANSNVNGQNQPSDNTRQRADDSNNRSKPQDDPRLSSPNRDRLDSDAPKDGSDAQKVNVKKTDDLKADTSTKEERSTEDVPNDQSAPKP